MNVVAVSNCSLCYSSSRTGVRTWEKFTEKTFASSINESLTKRHITQQGQGFLQDVLRKAKVPLILVVEVNERCSSEQLQSLLLVLKNWGADLRLVRPLVILSAAKAAFGLHIGLLQLRTVPFLVEDLTEAEAELLVKDICWKHTKKGAQRTSSPVSAKS